MINSLTDLEAVIADTSGRSPASSYTARLLADQRLCRRKVMEEAFELVDETIGQPEVDRDLVASEAADLFYHTLVLLKAADVSVSDVMSVLESRNQR